MLKRPQTPARETRPDVTPSFFDDVGALANMLRQQRGLERVDGLLIRIARDRLSPRGPR